MIIIATTIEEKTAWPIAHKVGEKRFYKVGYRHKAFVANKVYKRGEVVVAGAQDGKAYRVSAAGVSGGTEPLWQTMTGAITTSGTVTFFAIEENCFVDPTDVIESQTWTVVGSPIGITLETPTITGFETKVRVAVDATNSLTKFELVNHIVVLSQSGEREEFNKIVVVKVA